MRPVIEASLGIPNQLILKSGRQSDLMEYGVKKLNLDKYRPGFKSGFG